MKLGFGSVKASLGDDGKLKELVIYDGSKVFKVPADELKDLNSPDIRKLQVVTTQKKDFKSPSQLKDGDFFIIVLESDKPKDVLVVNEDKSNRIETVRNRVYFVFHANGYFHRARRVVLGRSSVWTNFYKDRGKPEIQNGTEKMRFDEYFLDNSPSLPCRD